MFKNLNTIDDGYTTIKHNLLNNCIYVFSTNKKRLGRLEVFRMINPSCMKITKQDRCSATFKIRNDFFQFCKDELLA